MSSNAFFCQSSGVYIANCYCDQCVENRKLNAILFPPVAPPILSENDPRIVIDPKPLTEGTKHDGDKIRTDLYPVASFLGTCRVLTHGAKKYAARNWEKGILFGRVYGALLRHLFAWWNGEDVDPESGEHHLDHVGCCIAFLQHYAKNPGSYAKFDDRPKQAVPAA